MSASLAGPNVSDLELLLTPALLSMGQRYFSDNDFRQRLHADLIDTLEQAEILLTQDEFELVRTWLPRITTLPNFPAITVLGSSIWNDPR